MFLPVGSKFDASTLTQMDSGGMAVHVGEDGKLRTSTSRSEPSHLHTGDPRAAALGRWATGSTLRDAELFQQPIEFLERSEGDRDLALIAASGALLDADFDAGRQRVSQLFFQPHDVA